jgi:hypothetical protein
MKLIGFVMTTFFSVIFGHSHENNSENKDSLPLESFSIVEATIDNKPVVGSFNMAYNNYDKREKYPWCLKIMIGLDLDNLFENGLPKDSESAIANRLEDELLTNIKKYSTAHYIGHLFNDTFLDIYIYLDEPKKVHKYLQSQVNKKGLVRGFGYEIKQDLDWEIISGFLKWGK